MFDIIYYDAEDYKNFLMETPTKLAVKIVNHIKFIEEGKIKLSEPYSKHIKNGIYELRFKQSINIARIFYFYEKNKVIVITNYYMKKAMKLDKNIIKKALEIRKEYKNI